MAGAFVQKTTQFSATAASSVASSTLATTAGNTAFLTIAHWVASGSAAPTIVDSKGNTGTVNQSTVDASPGTSRASIGSIPLVSAGAGHSWTINFVAGTYCEGNVSEFSGIAVTPLDQVGGSPYNSAASGVTVNGAGNTSQGDEIVIGCICTNTGSSNSHVDNPPAGFTSLGVQINNLVTIGYEAAYAIASIIYTPTVTWNFDAAFAGAGVIVSYKATAGTSFFPSVGVVTLTGNAPVMPTTTPGLLGHFDPELRLPAWF